MKENTLFSVYLYIDFALILVYCITIARKQQQTKQEGMDMKNTWNIVHDYHSCYLQNPYKRKKVGFQKLIKPSQRLKKAH